MVLFLTGTSLSTWSCGSKVGGGGHSSTLLYTCVNKKNKEKGVFFQPRMDKAGNTFTSLKMSYIFREKWVVLPNISQNPQSLSYLRIKGAKSLCKGYFCVMTKMCLGIFFKTTIYACVHLHI